jgi:ADP-ribose pyrophosphatase YjhB (NUDIX family)
LFLLADELRGMATIGRHFADNPYEVERAHRINQMAAEVAALADMDHTPDDVRAIFSREPWHRVSPAIGCDAVVFNPQGEILLIQRVQDGTWATPGGLAEIGHSPAETALRELWEEAGLRGRVIRLLAVFDGRYWGSNAVIHSVSMPFHIECDDLTPKLGIETTAWGFFAEDALPEPMHPPHVKRVPKIFELMRTGETFLDPACSDDMNLPMQQRPKE